MTQRLIPAPVTAPPRESGEIFSTLLLLALALLLAVVACSGGPMNSDANKSAWDYPQSERGEVTDDYFGTVVADAYRWLEDLDGEKTATWVAAQNALSQPWLEALPARAPLIERLTELWDHPRYGQPAKEGGRYFWTYNDGLQNHSVLMTTPDLAAEPTVLLDPNGWSEDGTVSLAGVAVSPDGRHAAYSRSDGGSDWNSWHVIDIEKGEDLDEVLGFTKFTSVSWSRDGEGFYYSRYPEGEDGEGDDQKAVAVYFHRLGTDQSADTLVHDEPDHERRNPYATVTEDGRYLVISVQEGYLTNAVYYRDLARPDSLVVKLLDDWDALYNFLGNLGSVFYFQSTLDAPRGRVLAIDTKKPARSAWRDVVPQREETLRDSSLVGGRLVTEYLRDVLPLVNVHSPDGTVERSVELPGIGSVGGFEGDIGSSETFYTFSSFVEPSTIYRYDVASGESELFRRAEVALDGERFETSQVFFESSDGTRIPMFLTYSKGVELDGSNPTLLYGYGGFNISLTPGFSVSRAVWLDRGGVLAIPNLRGGGEYGKEWHLAGTKERKQNVFDDFIAAAEWLIANGYTSTEKLVIQGGSNGGLLVGAAMTQRPDLFGAALPAVGVLDMLRYHLPSANARNWNTDYGLSEVEEEFRAQYAYSPYHNVKPGTCFPPTLVTTADHDDRVVPWHSFKFAAELQHAQRCDNPVLIRVETRAGHGAGKPTWMQIENIADQFAFALWALGADS